MKGILCSILLSYADTGRCLANLTGYGKPALLVIA
jgi:hypothetical protein